VLQECITKAGSVEGGLKFYVGAGNNADDGGYAGKVMAEHARLLSVVGGKNIPHPVRTMPVKLEPTEVEIKTTEKVAALVS
jgi:hypothetical protein